MHKYITLDNPSLSWLFTIVTYVPFARDNPTWTELGVNPRIHGEWLATVLAMAVSTSGLCREYC